MRMPSERDGKDKAMQCDYCYGNHGVWRCPNLPTRKLLQPTEPVTVPAERGTCLIHVSNHRRAITCKGFRTDA